MYWSSLRFRTSRYLKPAGSPGPEAVPGPTGAPEAVLPPFLSAPLQHCAPSTGLKQASHSRQKPHWVRALVGNEGQKCPVQGSRVQGELEGVTLHDLNVAHSGLSDPAAAGCRHLSIQVQGVQAPANQKFGQGNCEESRTAPNVCHGVVNVDGAKAQDHKGIGLICAARREQLLYVFFSRHRHIGTSIVPAGICPGDCPQPNLHQGQSRRNGAQGLWIIFESRVTIAATGIWSPFPIQPGWCLQECSSWDVNLPTRRVLSGIAVLALDQGSGFRLRRE